MVRCVGYLRVSTVAQAGEVQTSLEEQQTQIEALAARMGVTVQHWYRDAGASGASVHARPAFRQLLTDCETSRQRTPAGLVLVYDDSRFGRFPDPDEAAYWRHHLRTLGWIVRFTVGDDVEDVGMRHILRAIGGAQSSEERAKIRRRARAGRRGSALQGFWTGREPIGYRRKVVYPAGSARVLEPGQRKATSERVTLVPHEEEAQLVRWVFAQYASGEVTLHDLALELLRRRPERRWSKTVVNHLLRNPAYVGDIVGGRRRADRTERLTLGELRPEAEWYTVRDAHEAIVPRALWEAVQQRLAGNRRLGRAVRAHYLLSGILSCVYCGGHFAGGGSSKSVRSRAFYREAGSAPCPGPRACVARHLVDDTVLAELGRVVRSKRQQAVIEREIGRMLDAAQHGARVSPQALRRKADEAQRKLDRLTHAVERGALLPEEVASRAAALRTERDEAAAQAQSARFSARRFDDALRRRLLERILDFPTMAAAMSPQSLRDVVATWLADATFDKATRELTLFVRPVPGFVLAGLGAPVGRVQVAGRLIRRRICIAPKGFDVTRAAADIERARRRA